MAVSPIPEGYHSVTPYMIIDGAAKAIEWYANVFGSTEVMRLPGPDDIVMHAEIKIGNSHVMLADPCPDMEANPPAFHNGSPTHLMIYMEDVDSTFQKAVDAGAEVLRPLVDQFYGDRSGSIKDPFGHQWTLATHVEDVPDEELQRRIAEFSKQASQ